MSGFSADWLALREPFDRAARAQAARGFDWASLMQALRRGRADGAPLGVLDLACGTGANLRELAPRLGGAQRWLLIDHDPALLAAVPAALAAWADARQWRFEAQADGWTIRGDGVWQVDVECRCVDLALALDTLPFASAQLVTCSALLDLVAEPWLAALVDRCCTAHAALLCGLSVDGRIEWTPREPDDQAVHRHFEAHQRRGKGFGAPALGPAAVSRAAQALGAATGYRVVQSRSDWQIDAARGEADRAMLVAMIDGLASAAIEHSAADESMVDRWRAARLARLAQTRLRVGHLDLLALPPAARQSR